MIKNILLYDRNMDFCLCLSILFPLGLIYYRIVKIEEDFKQFNELKQVELMMKGIELGIYEEENEDEKV